MLLRFFDTETVSKTHQGKRLTSLVWCKQLSNSVLSVYFAEKLWVVQGVLLHLFSFHKPCGNHFLTEIIAVSKNLKLYFKFCRYSYSFATQLNDNNRILIFLLVQVLPNLATIPTKEQGRQNPVCCCSMNVEDIHATGRRWRLKIFRLFKNVGSSSKVQ